LQPAFSPSRKPHWYQLFSSTALDLVQAISDQNTSTSSGTDKSPINLSRMLSQLGLDTIGKDCVGTEFNSLKSPRDNKMLGYLKLFNTSANAHLLEIIMHLFPFWLLEALPVKAVQYARSTTDQVRETVQDEAVENMSAQDHGQEKQDKDDEDKNMVDCMRRDLLSPEQVVNNALTMVTAGHEEIGTALTWVVYFLIHHKEVQTRLRHDITSALGRDWKEQGFVEDDFSKLPYLRAVINESLRLRPNVPVIWRESTTPTTLLDTAIPRHGTVITASTWAMNRNVDEWGKDATDFNPDRWLDDPNGGAKSPFSFMTFGQGPRKCIGELYARTQMECVLAALVGNFVFSSANKLEHIVPSQGMITVKVWQGLRVFATPVERVKSIKS
jgi:cytochrome P450